MRSLELREDATTLEIDAAIRDAFTDIQGRLEYPLDGWRLLMKIDGDQGESGRLRFYRQGSEVTWFHIDKYVFLRSNNQSSVTPTTFVRNCAAVKSVNTCIIKKKW